MRPVLFRLQQRSPSSIGLIRPEIFLFPPRIPGTCESRLPTAAFPRKGHRTAPELRPASWRNHPVYPSGSGKSLFVGEMGIQGPLGCFGSAGHNIHRSPVVARFQENVWSSPKNVFAQGAASFPHVGLSLVRSKGGPEKRFLAIHVDIRNMYL
jgi:hypothetical protein